MDSNDYTPYGIYRLMKAEERIGAIRPHLANIRHRLEQFGDLVDFTIEADLTREAKDALEYIKRYNTNHEGVDAGEGESNQ